MGGSFRSLKKEMFYMTYMKFSMVQCLYWTIGFTFCRQQNRPCSHFCQFMLGLEFGLVHFFSAWLQLRPAMWLVIHSTLWQLHWWDNQKSEQIFLCPFLYSSLIFVQCILLWVFPTINPYVGIQDFDCALVVMKIDKVLHPFHGGDICSFNLSRICDGSM